MEIAAKPLESFRCGFCLDAEHFEIFWASQSTLPSNNKANNSNSTVNSSQISESRSFCMQFMFIIASVVLIMKTL
jgi:hypothetical protein